MRGAIRTGSGGGHRRAGAAASRDPWLDRQAPSSGRPAVDVAKERGPHAGREGSLSPPGPQHHPQAKILFGRDAVSELGRVAVWTKLVLKRGERARPGWAATLAELEAGPGGSPGQQSESLDQFGAARSSPRRAKGPWADSSPVDSEHVTIRPAVACAAGAESEVLRIVLHPARRRPPFQRVEQGTTGGRDAGAGPRHTTHLEHGGHAGSRSNSRPTMWKPRGSR